MLLILLVSEVLIPRHNKMVINSKLCVSKKSMMHKNSKELDNKISKQEKHPLKEGHGFGVSNFVSLALGHDGRWLSTNPLSLCQLYLPTHQQCMVRVLITLCWLEEQMELKSHNALAGIRTTASYSTVQHTWVHWA